MSVNSARAIFESISKYVKDPSVSIFLDSSDASEKSDVAAGHPYTYEANDKVLTIFTIVLTSGYPDGKDLLLNLIREIHDSGDLILCNNSSQTLKSYISYSEKDSNADILKRFKPVLDQSDFEALRMAYFMKSQVELGKNVSYYKKNIREKFDSRGANIANLCSTGYFEDEFLPLLDSDIDQFKKFYDLAVGQKARAMFIHSGMNTSQILNEFLIMIDKAKKYHLGSFRIHCIGDTNVSNAKQVFDNIDCTQYENCKIEKKLEVAFPRPAIEYCVSI